MPYVAPDEALNLPSVDLEGIRQSMGPPPWRQPLVGTDATRCVLLAWPAGYVATAHQHPRADEIFQVLRGRAVFRFDGEPVDRLAVPGTLLLAPRGTWHTISVPGPEPLLLLVCVSPNEPSPPETIETG